MVRKYKIIILICVAALLCNFAARQRFIERQSNRITILQKVIAAARSGSYIVPEIPSSQKNNPRGSIERVLSKIPGEFLFTEYAADIRALITRNRLGMENSLVFTPGKTNTSDVIDYKTTIRVRGRYPDLKNLIADLQNFPGMVNIDSAGLSRVKENPELIEMHLGLLIFFKRDRV